MTDLSDRELFEKYASQLTKSMMRLDGTPLQAPTPIHAELNRWLKEESGYDDFHYNLSGQIQKYREEIYDLLENNPEEYFTRSKITEIATPNGKLLDYEGIVEDILDDLEKEGEVQSRTESRRILPDKTVYGIPQEED